MLEIICSLGSSLPLLGLLLLTIAYYFTTVLRLPKNYPPMPRTPLPIVGHAGFLRPSPPATFLAWKKQVGNVFSFYLGSDLHICLSSYAALREALVKQADYFSERPSSFTRRVIAEGELEGLAGPDWKEHRNVSLSILRSFGMGRNQLAVKINGEVEKYLQVLSDMRGRATNIKILTNSAVSNVICAVLFGQRFDYEDQYFLRLLHLMTETARLLQTASIIGVFPWLRFLPGDLFGVKRMRKISRELDNDFSQYYIDKFKSELDDMSNENFIKAILREMTKRKESGTDTKITESSINRMIGTLFFTGAETTSSTILWAMIYLVNYPDIQKKVYEEIREVVGLERVPNLQDKLQLNYLNAFIAETLRHANIAPLGIPHLCTQTTTVDGYTIPKDATIFPHIDAIFKDEETWGDPTVFRPDRFISKDGQFAVPEEFVPFSMGRRNCLGESLAKMELYLFISAIIQRFELLPEIHNSPPSMEPDFGLGYIPKPFHMRLVERT